MAHNDWEVRGVSLDLLKSVANLAKERDSVGVWSIGRIGSELVGNHEILKVGHRWGNIKPEVTLTYEAQCSVIELLRQEYFSTPHPILKVPYEGNVDIANQFISFAYNSDFLELIDCLDRFFAEHKDVLPETTFFWFDALVNNQWIAADKSFDWWATTFRTAVHNIGHTLLFLTPWEAPVMLTRAWCLFEIACSENITCLLSQKSEYSLWEAVGKNPEAIISSLCNIDVEKSGTFLPSDREQIFEVVRKKEGGFVKINFVISFKIRNWLCYSMEKGFRYFLQHRGEDDPITLGFATRVAAVYCFLQNYEKCHYFYQFAYERSIHILGNYHMTTIGAIVGIAIIENLNGNHMKAVTLYQDAIQFTEEMLQPGSIHMSLLDEANLEVLKIQYASIYGNLGSVYLKLLQYRSAIEYLEKSFHIREQYHIPINLAYFNAMEALGIAHGHLQNYEKVDYYYDIVLNGLEKHFGVGHIQYLTACLNQANNYKDRKLYDLAKQYYEKAIIGYAKALGTETQMYALILRAYGLYCIEIGDFIQAKDMLYQSYQLYSSFTNCTLEEKSFAFDFYLQVIEKVEGMEAVKTIYDTEFEEALNQNEVLIGDGSRVHALSKYGLSCIQLNDWEKAEKIFEKLIQIRYFIIQNQLAADNLPTKQLLNNFESKITIQNVPQEKEEEKKENRKFFSGSMKKGKAFIFMVDFLNNFLTNFSKRNDITMELYIKNHHYHQLFYQSCVDLFGTNEIETYYAGILYGMTLRHYKKLESSKIQEILLLYEDSVEKFALNFGNDHDLAISSRFVLSAIWKDNVSVNENSPIQLSKAYYHAKLSYELYMQKEGTLSILTINSLYIVALIETLQNNVLQCFSSWLLCCQYRYEFYTYQKIIANGHSLEREMDMFCKILGYVTEKNCELLPFCIRGIDILVQTAELLEKVLKYLPSLAKLICLTVSMIRIVHEKNKQSSVQQQEQQQQAGEQLSPSSTELPNETTIYKKILPLLNGNRGEGAVSPSYYALSDLNIFNLLWQYFLCLSKLPGSHDTNHEILQILGQALISASLLPSPKHEQLYSQICSLNLQIANNVQLIPSLEAWNQNIMKLFEVIEKEIQTKMTILESNKSESTGCTVDRILTFTSVDPAIMMTRIQKFYEFASHSYLLVGQKLMTSATSATTTTTKHQILVNASNYFKKAFHYSNRFHQHKEHLHIIQHIVFPTVNCLKSIGTYSSSCELCDEYLKPYLPYFRQKYRIEHDCSFETFYYSSLLILAGTSLNIRRFDDSCTFGKEIIEYIYFYSSQFYQNKSKTAKEETVKEISEDAADAIDANEKEAQDTLMNVNTLLRMSFIESYQFEEGLSYYETIHSSLLLETIPDQDGGEKESQAVASSSLYNFFHESLYLPSLKIILEAQQDYQVVCDSYPASISHASHADHPLCRIPCAYQSGSFSCNLCRESGQGLVYHCKQCNYDLHLTCGYPINKNHEQTTSEETTDS